MPSSLETVSTFVPASTNRTIVGKVVGGFHSQVTQALMWLILGPVSWELPPLETSSLCCNPAMVKVSGCEGTTLKKETPTSPAGLALIYFQTSQPRSQACHWSVVRQEV